LKAAVCREFGKPLVVEDINIAPPHAQEIRVRVKACGVCHSDVSYIEGAWGGPLPAVYGHEAAGVVEQVGPGVTGLNAGDHVVVALIRWCGRCYFCGRGMPVFCEGTFRLDRESPLTAGDGSRIVQGLRTGAFAEQIVVHASQAVKIPDQVPLDSASLLACGVITGVGAVVNTAAVEPGSSVVVIGTGGVGLNTVQAAVLAGAATVIAVDLSSEKLAAARSFGATHTINPIEEGVAQHVDGLTAGRGADYVFVTVGSRTAVEQGLTLMRRGGTMVIVGMPASGVTSAFDPGQVANDGHRILGTKMGAARLQIDVPVLLGLYQEGRLKLDELVSRRFPLGEINQAIASAPNGETLRNVIVL
jgi:S-(hydroxymethyl)glutathione dehydrogenase / alcohol dehydrogenase